ncbi:MAG: phosphate-starvation-inducible PsiE family protein [Candidatus Omnitrophica bacterium]|nr:phosphate-starvation-inducible PsiE family protein [Candidatus Omnitrophota bacterium]
MKAVDEPLIIYLQKIIHFAVRLLAILMTFVIIWGVGDVVYELYKSLVRPPFMLLNINDILATFGAFMAVLIAIEIFINITIYLKEEVIHVKIVLATALMAIARKVIIFDYDKLSPHYIWATAVVILALSIGYWLITIFGREDAQEPQ